MRVSEGGVEDESWGWVLGENCERLRDVERRGW